MKHFILSAILSTTLAAGIQAVPAIGQETDPNPNRLLVVDQNGSSFESYTLERVGELQFRTVEGPVAAEIQLGEATMESIDVNVTMTAACRSYYINCIPGVLAGQMTQNPTGTFAYLRSINSPQYSEDFTSGKLSGLEMKPNTQYAVITAGIDEYGTECDIRLAYFRTPSKPLDGDPQVKVEVTDTQLTSITASFTPNKDTGGYAALIGEKGSIQTQFEQFAGMMGFENESDMVRGWGYRVDSNEPTSHVFKELDPNTEYELYVQVWDNDETDAPLKIYNARTQTLGGSGAASVDIKVAKYENAEWDGEMKPSLYLTFTPNKETWRYRMGVYLASEYSANKAEIEEGLRSEPPMPMAFWWQFQGLTTDYQVNPSTDVVILTVAQNANGEWGEFNRMEYKTPASVSGAPAMKAPVKTERIGERRQVRHGNAGRVPTLRKVELQKR